MWSTQKTQYYRQTNNVSPENLHIEGILKLQYYLCNFITRHWIFARQDSNKWNFEYCWCHNMVFFFIERNVLFSIVFFFHTKNLQDSIVNYYLKTGITKSCTHFHSAPSTSTQLHPSPPSSFQPPPSSIHLHPTHFSLHEALCNTLNVIRTKISHVIGEFPQI